MKFVKNKSEFILFIVLVLVILLAAAFLIERNMEEVEDKDEPITLEMIEEFFGEGHVYTFSDIQKVMQSKEYSEADTQKRLNVITLILEQMVQDGSVESYTVYMNDVPPSVHVVDTNGFGINIVLESHPEGEN